MDFPAYKNEVIPHDTEGKTALVRRQDHKSVILQDVSFDGLFKKGVVLASSESEATYLFLDPVTGKRITLRYQDLNGLLVRDE